jgi:hypothetical protein
MRANKRLACLLQPGVAEALRRAQNDLHEVHLKVEAIEGALNLHWQLKEHAGDVLLATAPEINDESYKGLFMHRVRQAILAALAAVEG